MPEPVGVSARSAGLALVLLTIFAFLPILVWGGWVWDDLEFIVWNPRLLDGDGLYALWFEPGRRADAFAQPLAEPDVYWWPLLYSSLWLERWLWGEFYAPGFHATNVAIHCLNVWLVWTLLRRFTVPGAWLIALVFAVHPGQMMAPALVMGRKELLASLCVLLAVRVWFPPGDDRSPISWKRVTAVCLLVVVGSLFKTQAVVIPAAVAVVHWWQTGRLDRGFRLRLAPVAGVSVVMAGLAWYMFAVVSYSSYHDFTFVERVLISARSLWLHGFLSLVPVSSVLRFWRWEVSATDPLGWLALAGCIAGLVVLCRWAAKNRNPLAAAMWFVVGVSPILGLIDHYALGLSFAFSRHRYLSSIASIALLIGPVYGWLRAHGSFGAQAAGRFAAVVFVLVCVLTDLRYSFAFASSSLYWTHVARYHPGWDWVQGNVSLNLAFEDKAEEALTVARRHLDADPSNLRFRFTLGLVYAYTDDLDGAMPHYRIVADALEADPSLMIPLSRLRRREHLRQMPLHQQEVYYLRFAYGNLLACAGQEAAAAHQHRLARRLFPQAEFEQAFTEDDPHWCAEDGGDGVNTRAGTESDP